MKFGRSKVYDLIRSKRLVSITEGRSRRIPENALHDYIRNRIEEAA
ncbi:helix-turn-helix domain-containing protein [Streptomyces halobius]|nr:helix-turn-helix domain-containing protein [Streptomyces halobius]